MDLANLRDGDMIGEVGFATGRGDSVDAFRKWSGCRGIACTNTYELFFFMIIEGCNLPRCLGRILIAGEVLSQIFDGCIWLLNEDQETILATLGEHLLR